MLPTMHPVSKTSAELRRALNRLTVFKEQFPDDPYVVSGEVDNLIKELYEARTHIPRELRDTDLNANKKD